MKLNNFQFSYLWSFGLLGIKFGVYIYIYNYVKGKSREGVIDIIPRRCNFTLQRSIMKIVFFEISNNKLRTKMDRQARWNNNQ
jgi:hypothetical protein